MDSRPIIGAIDESLKREKKLIAYNVDRIDYTVDDNELKILENAGGNYWKDIFFLFVGIAVPSFTNLAIEISRYSKELGIGTDILINSIFSSVCLVVSIMSYFAWKRDSKNFKDTIAMIKSKPLHDLVQKEGSNE